MVPGIVCEEKSAVLPDWFNETKKAFWEKPDFNTRVLTDLAVMRADAEGLGKGRYAAGGTYRPPKALGLGFSLNRAELLAHHDKMRTQRDSDEPFDEEAELKHIGKFMAKLATTLTR